MQFIFYDFNPNDIDIKQTVNKLDRLYQYFQPFYYYILSINGQIIFFEELKKNIKKYATDSEIELGFNDLWKKFPHKILFI